ncbi:hypothetical protein [Prevotella sp.]|uniref:hypothetical protein n=1 Tax=Prevotella sp. TaxID=59823 RepID=UPI0025D32AD5|nr:hypothetical protein [Prevotella sp.]
MKHIVRLTAARTAPFPKTTNTLELSNSMKWAEKGRENRRDRSFFAQTRYAERGNRAVQLSLF